MLPGYYEPVRGARPVAGADQQPLGISKKAATQMVAVKETRELEQAFQQQSHFSQFTHMINIWQFSDMNT